MKSVLDRRKKKQPNPYKIKVGDTFWGCMGYYDGDTDKVSVEFREWVVRTIRRPNNRITYPGKSRRVYMVEKTWFTWVKKAGKKNPYLWSDNISKWNRETFTLGSGLPHGVYVTQLQALLHEKDRQEWYIASCKDDIKDIRISKDPGELAQEEEELAYEERILKAVKTRITKMQRKNKERRRSNGI
jgi:hypothetical protein